MGGPKEATMNLEVYEGEVICELCGGPLDCIHWVEFMRTWELDRDQAHYRNQEGEAAINVDIRVWEYAQAILMSFETSFWNSFSIMETLV